MKTSVISVIASFFFFMTVSAEVFRTGADRIDKVVTALKDKKAGLVVNHTSVLSRAQTHLLDTLLKRGIDISVIFAPEHGFRGDADAGETILNGVDVRTKLPVVSLYGKNKRPTAEQLKGLDIVVFDIQDVGTRFYTYISTMYYVMQSCASSDVEVLILDRPNPNDYVDGPVMRDSLMSFVGALPIPVLHGLTVGELACMIKGEGWGNTHNLRLRIVPVTGWKHGDPYSLPVKPSPNLPSDQSVRLYPSLCFFEATDVSVGRGTYYPFQVIGYPDKRYGEFRFTPVALPGFDKNPLQKDKVCYGLDLRNFHYEGGLSLGFLLDFYRISSQGGAFFTRPRFFDMLMGNSTVRKDITDGLSESRIKAKWEKELTE